MNLDDIGRSVSDLDARLGRIEKRLGLFSAPATAATPIATPATPAAMTTSNSTPIHSPFVTPVQTPLPAQATNTPFISPTQTAEPISRSGNWLGGIAVVCFVLAAAFIVKLSIESGWLTPARQIGIAALFSLGLIVAGLVLRTRVAFVDRGYISYLPAAGVISLYVTCFAAHHAMQLISGNAALGLAAGISALCVWLYTEIRHDVYAVTAAVGAYLAPVISDMPTGTTFSLYYFGVCSVAFAVISMWVNSRIMAAVAAYFAIIMTASADPERKMMTEVAIALAFNFVVFALGTFLHTRQSGRPLSTGEAYAFFPVLLIFYAFEYGLLQKIAPGLAPWISVGFATFLFMLYVLAKKFAKNDDLASRGMILSFITIVLFHSIYIESIPDDLRPWLFSIIMIIYGVTAKVGGKFAVAMSAPSKIPLAYRVPVFAITAIIVIEYATTIFLLIGESREKTLPLGLISLAAFWAAIILRRSKTESDGFNHSGILLSAHVLAVFALFKLADPFGSFAVSATWLIYAAAVIAYAFSLRDRWMAKSAMMILGLSAAKALIYDASSAPTLVRIGCLILTGFVLYGAGFALRRVDAWKA